MAQIDVVNALTYNDVEDEAEKDPGDESVGVVTVLGILDITEGEEIQLLPTSAACRVDGEEDGPSHETADKADGHGNLEISK